MYETCKLVIVEREVEYWSFGKRSRHQLDKKLNTRVATKCTATPVASGDRTMLLIGISTKSAERFVQLTLETSP